MFGLQNWEWVQTEDPWKHTVRSLLAAQPPIVVQSQRIYGCHLVDFFGHNTAIPIIHTVNKWRFPKMVVPSDHPFLDCFFFHYKPSSYWGKRPMSTV